VLGLDGRLGASDVDAVVAVVEEARADMGDGIAGVDDERAGIKISIRLSSAVF
jgi:hypothetical protein